MESINEPPGPSFVNETDFQADAFRDGKLQFNILLFYTVFNEPLTDLFCEYPEDPFRFIFLSQCPAVKPMCIIDIPFDSSVVFERIRCSTAEYRANNTLEILSTVQMLKQIEFQLRSQGLLQCTLSAFYVPDCYFSAKMAPFLNALPRMFPRLRVVAVDASEHSKLYTRYGIVATPTIILWINGIPIARMDEAPFSLESFRVFLENRTDLEGIRAVNLEEGDRRGPLLCTFVLLNNFSCLIFIMFIWKCVH
ncbi:unnamed protein product [Enterobius vermicularis]|uniref:Thioredoxin domain-containing protein n=1 Tax=Enterobius vermicularis TaxID=51028 RepID=A0A0N4V2V2_ENTVE|nr:unnamed protein product [Enterobius vermicularis]